MIQLKNTIAWSQIFIHLTILINEGFDFYFGFHGDGSQQI